MARIALRLAYDGTHFAGSQWQTGQRTVQGELETAWERLTQEHQRCILSGRTDAGVHAQGQVAHVQTTTHHPPATIQRALNALLPPDVRVFGVWQAADDFHARFSAQWRWYTYLLDTAAVPLPLLRHAVWHVGRALDMAAMQAALGRLLGEHDFAAFASVQRDAGPTVRFCHRATCRSVSITGRPLVAIDLVANGFLRHMVRTIVGTLLLVGQQQMSVQEFVRVQASCDRRQAGPTAAAHGLTLMDVGYAGQPLPVLDGLDGQDGTGGTRDETEKTDNQKQQISEIG